MSEKTMARAGSKYLRSMSYAMVVAAMIVFGLSSWLNDREDFDQVESEAVREDALGFKSRLQSVVTEYELMTRSLGVALELGLDMTQAEFSRAATLIRGQDPDVTNMAVVRDFVIQRIHPYDINSHLIGRDLREVPRQTQSNGHAQKPGKTACHGPMDFPLGGRDMVFRAPIDARVSATGDQQLLNDFVWIVVCVEKFVSAAGQSASTTDRDVAIRIVDNTSGEAAIVFGDGSTFARQPLIETLSVGSSFWEIAVVPKDGWSAGYTLPFHWFALIALAGGFTLLSIARLHRETARAERAEIAANSAKAKLETAIEALPEGFLLFDAESRLTMYNQKCLELYEATAPVVRKGATLEEIVLYGLDHGEYVEAVGREEEWLEEQKSRLRSGESEFDYQLQNGKWIRSYNVPTSDGGRVGLRVDITRLRQQQAMLEDANAELREALRQRKAAEKRFFDIAKVSKDWFWEQDKHLRFTYFSSGFEKVLNVDSSRFLGNTRWEAVEIVGDGAAKAEMDFLDRLLEAHQPFDNYVYPMQVDDGSTRWIRISGAPVFDEDGAFSGYRGVGSDITVLYQALKDAKAASTAKSEFLSVISHELRTPLTVLLGYTAFLKEPERLPSISRLKAPQAQQGSIQVKESDLDAALSEVSSYAQKMNVSGQHLLGLINELLDLSKIESGEISIHPEPLSIREIIGSVVEQFRELATKKGISLSWACTGDEVYADRKRLQQVLINLVGNAIKFTDQGSVRIESELQGNEVSIGVTDTGPGIPLEKQHTIFDKFKQLENSENRSSGGTGLGLTITRHLVEMQRGRVEVESLIDRGSTFFVYLPAVKAETKRASKHASSMS